MFSLYAVYSKGNRLPHTWERRLTDRFFLRDAELHHPFQRVKASARNAAPGANGKFQTHKMDEAGMVLSPFYLDFSLSNLTFSEQDAQDYIQSGFEYLHQRGFHRLSGQLVPEFDHPPKRKKCFQVEFHVV